MKAFKLTLEMNDKTVKKWDQADDFYTYKYHFRDLKNYISWGSSWTTSTINTLSGAAIDVSANNIIYTEPPMPEDTLPAGRPGDRVYVNPNQRRPGRNNERV